MNFPAEFRDDVSGVHCELITRKWVFLCTVKFFLFNMSLFQSPHITSSSSSSEGDEEEADGEVGGEPLRSQEELSSGKTNSPPPSYNHQQVLSFTKLFGKHVLTILAFHMILFHGGGSKGIQF